MWVSLSRSDDWGARVVTVEWIASEFREVARVEVRFEMETTDVDFQLENLVVAFDSIFDGPVNIRQSDSIACSMGNPFENDCRVVDPFLNRGLVRRSEVH